MLLNSIVSEQRMEESWELQEETFSAAKEDRLWQQSEPALRGTEKIDKNRDEYFHGAGRGRRGSGGAV